MHETQERLLELAKQRDLSQLPLRQIAELIGQNDVSPSVIQHHFIQLEKRGLLYVDRKSKTQQLGKSVADDRFFNIPIVGMANCGPATVIAEENIEGYMKVSRNSLKGTSDNLIAVRAIGSSMDNAKAPAANGHRTAIEDGDFVIVDCDSVSLEESLNKYVLSIIGGMANIKKLLKREFDLALLSESTDSKSYPPIIIHEGDDYLINGRVVQVIKAA